MIYIIEIDGVVSTRYKYNVWSVFDNVTAGLSKDTRIFCTDDLKEFTDFISVLKGQE